MANPSNAPTNIKVYPIPGVGVEVHAVFHQANNLPATYARFQVSTDPNFGTTVYDSNQVAITPINDNTEGVMIFSWIPSGQGTYYYRLCFWDNANYTNTSWTVWNGTTVSQSSGSQKLYPTSDSSIAIGGVYPTSPTTHYDKLDEPTANDATDYIYTSGASTVTQQDLYGKTSFSPPDGLQSITSVVITYRIYTKNYQGNGTNACGYVACIIKTHNTLYLDNDQTSLDAWGTKTKTYTTNPYTGAAWTAQEITDLLIGVQHKITNGGVNYYDQQALTTQLYATVNYTYLTFTFTPPGDNILNIGYPSIISQSVSQDKDKVSFNLVINDAYTKMPNVVINIDGQTYQMDYVSRTGSGPYTYTFSKMISLEQGDHVYRYEIGNVWTLLISSNYFLNVNYASTDKSLSILANNTKINAWNVILTDNILPNVSEISFESDTLISSPTISVVMNADKKRVYQFRITNIQNTNSGYSYSAVSSFDLQQTVSTSVTAMKSIDFLKSILNTQVFGNLTEYLYLQQYDNATLSDLLEKVLIINGARGYERNGKFYFRTDSDIKYKLTKADKSVSWSEDRKVIRNYIQEYYIIKQYPVVSNSLTNYDASNWSGTVSNATQTANGLLAPSGSPYILKGNGTITRSGVSFKITDFDHLTLNWSPPTTSTTLTIQLLADASNYLSYTRSFAGSQGAGFVLTSANPSDEVVKTITFTSKYIHYVQGKTSNFCSVKVVLKLNGNTVSETGWNNTLNNEFIFIFDNIQADTLEVHFKNLYPVGTSYGVNCQNLQITEYAQVASGSQTSYQTTWSNDIANFNIPYIGDNAGGKQGTVIHFVINNLGLFSVPPLDVNESYETFAQVQIPTKSADGYGLPYYDTYIFVPVQIRIQNGQATAWADYYYTVSRYYETYAQGQCYFNAHVAKVKTTVTTEYVWKYIDYVWSASYPMWDSVDVPISQFSKTGAPVNITQISLTATGDNFYDNLYVYASRPTSNYITVKDDESIRRYGERLDVRKLDGWTSKESATLFATKYLDIFKDPAYDYRKEVSIETPIELGDAVDCDGNTLYVYRISYDWDSGKKTIFVGMNASELLERLKQMAQKIDLLEKNIL